LKNEGEKEHCGREGGKGKKRWGILKRAEKEKKGKKNAGWGWGGIRGKKSEKSRTILLQWQQHPIQC